MRLIIIDDDGSQWTVYEHIDKFKACNFLCVADLVRLIADVLRKIKIKYSKLVLRKRKRGCDA